jgi:hypothetical protein
MISIVFISIFPHQKVYSSPHEFRATRNIQPIQILKLGVTSRTQREFEDWCIAQGNGRFSINSYDLLTRNCNNFSDEAARELVGKSIPSWILEVPQKFLSSPMGMMVRPLLEGMQMTNNAPTKLTHRSAQQYTPTASSLGVATAANPWANIEETPLAPKETNDLLSSGTPFLDKQTALLSTETGVVKICIDRLSPTSDQLEVLSKLSNSKYSWTLTELQSVHQILRSFVSEDKQMSYALMLLRLAVLREPSSTEEYQSIELVADLLLDDKLGSPTNCSLAWCVLSNVIGSKHLPSWATTEGNGQSSKFLQLVDRALNDCDPSSSDAKICGSASAFLYNTARQLTGDSNVNDGTDGSNGELSEAAMSMLIGCLEKLDGNGETDDVTLITRLYMCIGQILGNSKTAVLLVKDLGMADVIGNDSHRKLSKDVQTLSEEVASLL